MNAQKEYDVVYIGRLARVKHVETLIKAICIVKEHNPYIRAVIVGDGPEKDKLEKLSKKLNLVKNIDFAGYQTDVWDWYNKSKLSVLTSEREGFPYSVVESLSCGLPVITSKCGDVCDLIKDGYNGVLINDNWDYHSFAEAITKLLQNPQIISKYSTNALKTLEKMDMDKVTNVLKYIIL
jgi:glycosyltransferase involved in cell wall biosynthesis